MLLNHCEKLHGFLSKLTQCELYIAVIWKNKFYICISISKIKVCSSLGSERKYFLLQSLDLICDNPDEKQLWCDAVSVISC